MSCDDAIKEYNKTYFNQYVKQLGTDINNNVPDPYTKFITTIKNDDVNIQICKQAIEDCEKNNKKTNYYDIVTAISIPIIAIIGSICWFKYNK